ncbi:MAG TPA: 3-isopropylmalate dehydratase [Bacillota bacterium]
MATFRGRVWKFGDNINTDLMMPNIAFSAPVDEQPKYVFWALRPEWSSQVRPGDILIGGRNFGTGSSRPAARQLVKLGIAALVAESINGLFLRNCVNFGLPAFSCPGVTEIFEEGQIAVVHFDTGVIENETTGQRLEGRALPPALRELTLAGGILPLLREEGFIS